MTTTVGSLIILFTTAPTGSRVTWLSGDDEREVAAVKEGVLPFEWVTEHGVANSTQLAKNIHAQIKGGRPIDIEIAAIEEE